MLCLCGEYNETCGKCGMGWATRIPPEGAPAATPPKRKHEVLDLPESSEEEAEDPEACKP